MDIFRFRPLYLFLHHNIAIFEFLQTRRDASVDHSDSFKELEKGVPVDDVILDGLRETRGARHTVESATAVFVKFPALAQQRYVSLRHLYFAISFLADSSSLYAIADMGFIFCRNEKFTKFNLAIYQGSSKSYNSTTYLNIQICPYTIPTVVVKLNSIIGSGVVL